MVRSTATLWVGSAPGDAQRIHRQPADIAVAAKLAPAPAFAVFVVDRDALALERFGLEHRIGHRRLAHRRDRIEHLEAGALDIARRRDDAAQMRSGEVGPCRA